ncbi:hypothetical protein [Actinotalea sp. C106]|uniref:hypothetical protein n=1 Tax=Actinotalea sp. C106 TaxID=2908644 RepID=UPI0020287003|nr:hypothetical protein [Actinotalea sp. C106]
MPWCMDLGTGGWLMLTSALAMLGVAVWVVTRLFPAAPEPDPVAVLDARLAAGEIDLETYRVLRAELGGRPRSRSGELG